ncbi:hypothetical protein F2Q70_00012355 [Brassica cretica]|uniref:Uncharacterized protein n=1 Tax=Brassica cretica TaxID=69181 RepID=A0A8S9LYG9_BRACR|nr:hypothetical protein F2Q70_00012355 [Brassica cretica]
MLGFVSYRRSGRVRSLRNDRALARSVDQAVCVLGRYVATELRLELGRCIATEPCACLVAIVVTDVPQSMDLSAQHEDQNIPDVPVEVHPSDQTRQTDRAVYRLDPRTPGLELRPDPQPDDRTDRTEARLYRPTRQAKADGQARINLGRANSDLDHGFSLLARLARTACTGDCADDLSSLFDPIMDFSFGYSLKQGSLSYQKTWAMLERILSDQNPARMHLDRSRTNLSCFLVSHIQANIFQTRWSCESYQATVRDSSFGGLVSHIKHQLKSGISEAFPQPSCDPSIHSVLHPEFISKSDPVE